jgi:hypothetical protein
VRRLAAVVVLAAGALLLSPRAPGVGDVPGDPSPPVVTPVIVGTLGNDGWYVTNVTVSWSIVDPESIILSTSGCDTRTLTADTPGERLACTAVTDGGEATAAKIFKIDKTPPSATASAARGPDLNGWYNAPLGVSFDGKDAMSQLHGCDPPVTYTGPDTASATVTGSCRDVAGNVASASLPLRYDASAPQVTAAPARAANSLGWHNAPVTVSFAASDSVSGPATCDEAKTYAGPDTAATTVTGTCRDNAGNTASGSLLLRYDATPPQARAAPSRQPNEQGWYSAPLAIGFSGSDAMAGIDACDAAKTYAGPDSATASVTGSCRDRAGNTAPASFALRYDATPPLVTATRSRPPNATGWYTAPLSIDFTGGDAMSGLDSCDGAHAYSGPDTPTASVTGACRDKAGNVGSGSTTLRYDATPPQATVTPGRQPNANGWYNASVSVGFAWRDASSGTGACEQSRTYAGPDAGSVTLSAVCTDVAGNSAAASFSLRYDATSPSATAVPARPPDANGWYRGPITVDFTGTDDTSGLDACTAPQTYAGPDAGAAWVSGSCYDRAGNTSASAVFGLKFDATPPVVTHVVPVRGADRADWYNRPVAFAVQGTDAMSAIDSCPAATYTGPDSASATFVGACLDKAGNRGTKSFALRYDATGPQVRPAPSRAPDANGWYNHPLAVGFDGADAISGIESCAPPETYSGPDSTSAAVSGICLDRAGNASVGSLEVRYDGTPPQVTGAVPSRPPDANGWYNRALVVSFQGADTTSDIDACTQIRYAGPDTTAISLTGSCRDRAGNASGVLPFALRYDATPPAVTRATVKPGNGNARIAWTASADTTVVEVRRAGRVVYRGTGRTFTDTGLRNGARYDYEITARDEAGNAASRRVVARPSAPLLSPAGGATVGAPPRLAWKPVPKATYYNVQLWRGGKILSVWPKGTAVQVKRSWVYRGRRYRLSPGRYRWYVWPYYGRRPGRLLGSSAFTVRAR